LAASGVEGLTPEIERLFFAVADLDPAARRRYFEDQRVDPATCAAVERLIEFDKGAATFLGTPLAAVAARIEQSVPVTDAVHVGPYKLIREIGRGGMGAVYEGERSDGELRLRVAVKFVSRAIRSDFVVERFKRERQILANLNHPNICRLIDAGTTQDESPYLVMELIEGQTIDVWAKGRSPREICKLFRHVCDAVQHAHQNLVVHRDLKPGNILVTDAGEPKLLDFGIAKLLDSTPVNLQNTIRALTPAYASPEQVEGKPITAAADIYGLGCVLYHLLTGRPPERHSARPASSVNPALRGDLEAILVRAMQLEPAARYATAREFGEELGRWLAHEPVNAVSGGWPYVAHLFVRRNRWLAAGMAATTIFLTVGTAYAWWRVARAERQLQTLSLGIDATHLAVAATPTPMGIAEAVREHPVRPMAAAQVLRSVGHYAWATKLLAAAGNPAAEKERAGLALRLSELAMDDGQLAEAASYARHGLALAETSAATDPRLALEAATQSALADQRLGRLTEARQVLSQALQRTPPRPEMKYPRGIALDRLAAILQDSGDLTQALSIEGSAINLDPQNPFFRSHLAQLFEASGERDQARTEYEWVYQATKLPVTVLSPRLRAERLQFLTDYAKARRWSGHLDESHRAIETALASARDLAAEFAGDRYAQLALARTWSARADHLKVTQPTEEQKSRAEADRHYVRLLEKTPADAEVLREFASSRLALVRLLTAAEAGLSCADALQRLKATPHPAVALVGRQLQLFCRSRQ
jgi:tRNA A-37 threonylcarbamoyl transferase component Bud32/tetratricopeptide (TPR) repeat protein